MATFKHGCIETGITTVNYSTDRVIEFFKSGISLNKMRNSLFVTFLECQ